MGAAMCSIFRVVEDVVVAVTISSSRKLVLYDHHAILTVQYPDSREDIQQFRVLDDTISANEPHLLLMLLFKSLSGCTATLE